MKRLLYWAAFVPLLLCFACESKTGDRAPATETSGEAAGRVGQADEETAAGEGEESGAGLAFAGVTPPEPDPSELPGPEGPFVEPPLLERPRLIHHVLVVGASDLKKAAKIAGRLAQIGAVPVGYPAVDQADEFTGAGDGWVVVAGKFARQGYARALAGVLKSEGISGVKVVSSTYRHDRFSPVTNRGSGDKVARVFAGMAGMEVPLLEAPQKGAPGTGKVIADGSLVEVVDSSVSEDGLWARVKGGESSGYLPVSRLLLEYNVFPSPNARRAVISISLGCHAESCRWDYWLVNRDYSQRRLLAARSLRLLHSFSPSGEAVAFSSPGRPLILSFEGSSDKNLGSGTSPSWSSSGKSLYFRRPGTGSHRDEVMLARAPDWEAVVLYDFRGKPYYPRALSAYPPQVDLLQNDSKLYTMFYRLVRKDGGVVIHRWKVLLTPDGKLISKKGERLTE